MGKAAIHFASKSTGQDTHYPLVCALTQGLGG
jgi:hypothetical protein